MSDPAVRVETRPDRVAVLTIDQPGAKVNVLTAALWDELDAALDALPPDLAGLVIASGKPGCFIAGADLKLLATATPGDPAVKAFIAQGLRVLAKLEALPFPTCAAIDGVALGGGLEVALACDWRVVTRDGDFKLGLPEVRLGLIPGWGGTQRLPRVIPREAATHYLVTGESLTVRDAIDTGLTDGTAPRDELFRAADTFLAKGSPSRGVRREGWRCAPPVRIEVPQSVAAQEVLRVANEGYRLPLADGIALETEAFLRLAGSDESRAKIAAFFAARKR